MARRATDAHPTDPAYADAIAEARLVPPGPLDCLLAPNMNLRPSLFYLLALCAALSLTGCATAATPPPLQDTAPARAKLPTALPSAESQAPLLVTSTPLAGSSPALPPSLVPTMTLLPQPAILESRRLTLEFPPRMRAGDSTRIRLQLEVDERGNLIPTAVVEGNVVVGETIAFPNLYDTHRVLAEARLDMAGLEVSPPGTMSEPLQPGLPVIFYWSVRPNAPGRYQGTAWLHLRFIPLAGGEESRIPISVQFVDIEARSFLGLSGSAARGIGTIGSAIGAVLGFPFVDDLLKWLWRRRKK